MNPCAAIKCLALATLFSLAFGVVSSIAEEGMTYSALQVAYVRELDGRSQYLAFAGRADLEGHAAAACLFAVVARAESVHAANHAAAIVRLGGTPAWHPRSFDVHGTAENLTAAILLEVAERDQVYRRFAGYAREECMYDALASINYARGAEKTHEALFRLALGTLDAEEAPQLLASATPIVGWLPSRGGSAATFYLCPGDGSVFSGPVSGGMCPNCGGGAAHVLTLACRR
jgi:rubrerythrin